MNRERIEGIGSIHGGEYESIHVEGVGKLKRDAKAGKVKIDGMFKSKGKLEADEVVIDGMARVFRELKVKRLTIDGMLKVRHARISAESIFCDGFLTCTGEVLADEIRIHGVCSVARMYGDHIHISHENGDIQLGDKERLFKFLTSLGKLYLGRKVSTKYNLVDQIECTKLEASGLKAKTIRANSVTLTDGCYVDKLYCDGEMHIDNSCKIGRIISANPSYSNQQAENTADKNSLNLNGSSKLTMKANQWRNNNMANPTIKKILDLYKNGNINADEAEEMLQSINPVKQGATSEDMVNMPWEDDGKLRIVAFIGRKLLKKGEELAKSMEVKYDGPALNVEAYGNLTCGDVKGNANAGGGMYCGDVAGYVSCGGELTCNDIGGNVNCGGDLTCKEVHGAIHAGGGVRIVK